MTTSRGFRCEVCGIVTSEPIHWFIIRCGDSELTVQRWNSEAANAREHGITAVKLTPPTGSSPEFGFPRPSLHREILRAGRDREFQPAPSQ
jgi:hypothetical protein